MRPAKALLAAALTGALFLVPATANAAPSTAGSKPASKPAHKPVHKPAHKITPRFVVSKLGIVGSRTTYDVTKAPATIRVHVQVKDFDKKFDPTSVKIIVVEKASGSPATTFTVNARRVGKSKVVSNWQATITVPAGSAAATYCIRLVKVDASSPAALPVLALAKGLRGRDCFAVVNKG